MPQFVEIFRCAGVDEAARPWPGMMVPLNGSNVVTLNTDRKRLQVLTNDKRIKVEHIDDPTVLIKKEVELNIALSNMKAEADAKADAETKQYVHAMMPSLAMGNPEYFTISAKSPVPFPGALVQAKSDRGIVEAMLRVVVLDPMEIKIAIRNVQIRGENGTPVYHAEVPCDPATEVDRMNAIWKPQANIFFTLIPSKPVYVDIADRATRLEIGKAYGLRDPDTAIFPDNIVPTKLKDVFKKHMIDGAAMTFFVVKKVIRPNGETVEGTMDPATGQGWIKGRHGLSTFAHEAGHFLGQMGHTFDDEKEVDIDMLMRDDGGGYKIPFALVWKFRDRPDLRRSAANKAK